MAEWEEGMKTRMGEGYKGGVNGGRHAGLWCEEGTSWNWMHKMIGKLVEGLHCSELVHPS